MTAAAPSPFDPVLHSLQLAWDATSLTAFMECPRKYQYSILEGWRSSAGSAALDFGGLYHSALESIDRGLARGEDLDALLVTAIRETLLASGHYEAQAADGTWSPCELELLGEAQHAGASIRWVPWSSLDSRRTPQTLIRSIIWYYESYPADQLKTAMLAAPSGERPAIELSFTFALPFQTPAGRTLLWCGHMDKVAKSESIQDNIVVERKTTTSTIGETYFSQFHMSQQITGYILAGQVVFGLPVRGAVVDAVQVAVGFSRFHRSLELRTEEQVAEWLENLRYWTALAEHYATINYWPMNLASCNNYGGCRYRSVCQLPASLRAQALETHFRVRKWNPLEVREEPTS